MRELIYIILTIINLLYFFISLFFERKIFKERPDKNFIGTFQSISALFFIGFFSGGFLGYLFGPPGISGKIDGFFWGLIIGGFVGIISGFILRKKIKSNKLLYYLTLFVSIAGIIILTLIIMILKEKRHI